MSTKYYVFGDIDCRGDKRLIKRTIDSSIMIELLELQEQCNNSSNISTQNVTSVAIDNLLDSLNFETAQAISLLTGEHLDLIKNGESFDAIGEEELFGFGTSQELAKKAYFEAVVKYDLSEEDSENDW